MLKTLKIDEIVAPKANVRKDKDSFELDRLKESIEKEGILQPLLVRKDGDKYHLIAGNRRYAAGVLAKLNEVPVQIVEANEEDVDRLQIIENTQRKDLSDLDEAVAYAELMKDRNYTVNEMSVISGKSIETIQKRMSLLNLDKSILEAVRKKKFSIRHAYIVAKAPKELQVKFAQEIINFNWTVGDAARDLEESYSYQLGNMKFDKKECKTCPNNSNCMKQDALFEEMETYGDGTCFNHECYDNKARDYAADLYMKYQEKGHNVVFEAEEKSEEFDKFLKGLVRLEVWNTNFSESELFQLTKKYESIFVFIDYRGNVSVRTSDQALVQQLMNEKKAEKKDAETVSATSSEKTAETKIKNQRKKAKTDNRVNDFKRKFWLKHLPDSLKHEVLFKINLHQIIKDEHGNLQTISIAFNESCKKDNWQNKKDIKDILALDMKKANEIMLSLLRQRLDRYSNDGLQEIAKHIKLDFTKFEITEEYLNRLDKEALNDLRIEAKIKSETDHLPAKKSDMIPWLLKRLPKGYVPKEILK